MYVCHYNYKIHVCYNTYVGVMYVTIPMSVYMNIVKYMYVTIPMSVYMNTQEYHQ
jgi:hypothetical protein